MANRSSIYKDGVNEVCLIIGAPIPDVIKLEVRESITYQMDSFTMEQYPVSNTYREYYLGEELLGKGLQDTPSPWSFRGEPPYKKALEEKGLVIINKSQGQVVGLALEGIAWASGVQLNTNLVDKTKRQFRNLLPHYKGQIDMYLFCFQMGEE